MFLGVSCSESSKGIRSAHRALASWLCPDMAGDQAARALQEVTEAYGVPSGPQRSSEYNHTAANGRRRGRQDSRGRDPGVGIDYRGTFACRSS